MKFALPRRRLYRVALYTLSIFTILLAIDLFWVRIDRHITVAPDITHLTSPLKADGFPDYVRFIQERASAGITPDNNAAAKLQEAFGQGILRDFAMQPFYDRLGLPLPPPTDHTEYAIPYRDFLLEQKRPVSQADELDATMRAPWKSGQYPDLAACIQRNHRALTLLHEAAQRPRYYCPMIATPGHDEAISMLVLQLGPLRSLCQLAVSRAMMNAADNHIAEAQADLLDVHKIARLLAQQPTLIEAAQAFTWEEFACVADQALACSGKLSASNAQDFLNDLQALPPFPPLANAIENGERLYGLDSTIFAARIGLPAAYQYLAVAPYDGPVSPFPTLFLLNFVPANFNDAMRMANHAYDQLEEATRAPTSTERMAIAHKMVDEVQHVYDTTWDPAKRLLSYLMPSLTNILIRRDSAAMQFDLTRISLALAAFHAEHHAYPQSLSELSPKYLASIPNDLFIDAPLCYEPQAIGYTLRSVGPKDPAANHPGKRNLTVTCPPTTSG